MDVTPRVIELHIDELMLEGVAASSRHAVGEALHAQLVRLFSEQPPSFDGDAALGTLTARPLSAVTPADERGLGAAIATSVHGEFAR